MSVKIGDIVKFEYPSGGDESADLVTRMGVVDKVAGWGLVVNTQKGYRSFRWDKIVTRVVIKTPITVV